MYVPENMADILVIMHYNINGSSNISNSACTLFAW